MKGIIVEINNKDAVVLSDDGLFIKVKNENYIVGQRIMVGKSRKTGKNGKPVPRWIAGAAGLAAAFAFCTIGAYAYYTPTDYVSLDVNPSVEYTINMFDRILDVKAVNDDGKEILASLDLNHMTIEDAVKETLDELIGDGYLTDDPDGGIVITTSNDEFAEAEQLAAELEEEITVYLDSQVGISAEVNAEAVKPERVEEARGLGVTPGKLNLVEKLQTSTTGAINTEEWLNKPVKEINKAIKENRKAEKKYDDQLELNVITKEEITQMDGGTLNPEELLPEGPGKPNDKNKSTNDGEQQNNGKELKDTTKNNNGQGSGTNSGDPSNDDNGKGGSTTPPGIETSPDEGKSQGNGNSSEKSQENGKPSDKSKDQPDKSNDQSEKSKNQSDDSR